MRNANRQRMMRTFDGIVRDLGITPSKPIMEQVDFLEGSFFRIDEKEFFNVLIRLEQMMEQCGEVGMWDPAPLPGQQPLF